MSHYIKCGEVAERPHLNLPKGTFEEELGLEGFFGPVSHLYHRHAPTQWTEIKPSSFQWKKPVATKEHTLLKPHCFKPITSEGDYFTSKKILFWNNDTEVSIHQITKDSPVYFRNADGHDLYFCHDGAGTLESPWGNLNFKKGHYVVVPRGVTARFSNTKATLLHIESKGSHFKKPETGILGQQALYHEEGIEAPHFAPTSSENHSTIRVMRDRVLTEIEYAHDQRAMSGWCGTLYPYLIHVNSIAPILSSVAHLPPSINATFIVKGFIVCTFLPRPLEEPEGALKVPFFHSNIDYDEVIFYHEGNFFSRDHMSRGSLTLHPRGIHHGPHPKALENQNKMKRTDEIAVMVDTEKTLFINEDVLSFEIADYWKSWGGVK